jgi:hypothetical protein
METPHTQNTVVLAVPPEPQWFYYLLGTLIFPIGIFLGVLYLRKDGYENRRFGTRSLSLGFVLPVMLLIIFVVSFFLI